MRDRGDELALELVQGAFRRQAAEGVDDPLAEGDAGNRKPDLAPVELERHDLGLEAARPGHARYRNQRRDDLPTGERLDCRPIERLLGGDAGDRLCSRIPMPDQPPVVVEKDSVVDIFEHARVPLERNPLLLDLTIESAKLDRAL